MLVHCPEHTGWGMQIISIVLTVGLHHSGTVLHSKEKKMSFPMAQEPAVRK